MSQRLAKSDFIKLVLEEHSKIVDDLIENIKLYTVQGTEKKEMISPGFKIRHKKTGLNYTAKSVEETPDGPVLITVKPTGEEFRIKKADLKKYERL